MCTNTMHMYCDEHRNTQTDTAHICVGSLTIIDMDKCELFGRLSRCDSEYKDFHTEFFNEHNVHTHYSFSSVKNKGMAPLSMPVHQECELGVKLS